jgi:hypothetical protein
MTVTIGGQSPGRDSGVPVTGVPVVGVPVVGVPVVGAVAHARPWDLPPPIETDEAGPSVAGLTLPDEPLSGPGDLPAFSGLVPERDDAPALPDEARSAVASAAVAVTMPLEAGPDQVLHIRFASASDERIVAAFGELRSIIKSRPGSTPVVLHIPAGPGRTQEMRLGAGVAYDAELVAAVSRSFGGLLQLSLS